MNVNNFIVRPKRRLVEKYSEPKAWDALGLDERNELIGDVAGLPLELIDDDQEAKQFDSLMLRLQLGYCDTSNPSRAGAKMSEKLRVL